MLGLSLQEESKPGRAYRLYTELSKEKLLLILDDVWSYIDFAKTGIPHGGTRPAGLCLPRDKRIYVLLWGPKEYH